MSRSRCFKKKILVIILATVVLLSSLFVFPVSAASSWSKSRPSSDTVYDETIGNAYTDGKASVGMGVHIIEYDESMVPDDNDYLRFRVSVSANTRESIQYSYVYTPYLWQDVSEQTNITDDDQSTLLDLPFYVLYYGIAYNQCWVCSNGFLSFDNNSTSPVPQNIPNPDMPNSTVAVFWRDLNPSKGGSITYGYLTLSVWGCPAFIISWNNVPDDISNIPQTFQIVILDRPAGCEYDHNYILLQYKNITKDHTTTVGVENQLGDKGTSYNYCNLNNESSLKFYYGVKGYRLNYLTIRLVKSDSYAKLDFLPSYIGGYNVVLDEPETNPFGGDFKSAIKFAANLMMGSLFGAKVGIAFTTIIIIGEAAMHLATALSPPTLPFRKDHADENETEAWIKGGAHDEVFGLPPFDSTLAATVEWSFTDPNS